MTKRLFTLTSLMACAAFLVSCASSNKVVPDKPSFDDAYANSVISEINKVRQAAGLNALFESPRLTSAAKGHSTYLLDKAEINHYQLDKESRFFTGYIPANRLKKEGFDYSSINEVIRGSYSETPSQVVGKFVDAPFHRIGLLRDDLVEVGVGALSVQSVGYKMVTVDTGSRELFYFGSRFKNPIVYPFDGQTGVPSSFASDEEVPDPYKGKNYVGYPISLQLGGHDSLYVLGFEIFTEGKRLPARVLWRENFGFLKSFPYAAVLIPDEPLFPGTTYTVNFRGLNGSQSVEKSWSFSTAP